MFPRLPNLRMIVALLALPVFAQTASPPPSPIRAVDGASIFRNHCAACHGLDGQGAGPVSAALKKSAPNLTGLSQRHGGVFPALHVRNAILFGADDPVQAHGSKDMPIWGPIFHEIQFDQDLGNVRLENITRYLESIQRK